MVNNIHNVSRLSRKFNKLRFIELFYRFFFRFNFLLTYIHYFLDVFQPTVSTYVKLNNLKTLVFKKTKKPFY